jgi:phage FluMu protein Com
VRPLLSAVMAVVRCEKIDLCPRQVAEKRLIGHMVVICPRCRLLGHVVPFLNERSGDSALIQQLFDVETLCLPARVG